MIKDSIVPTEEVPLKYLLLEYKMKFRLAMSALIFLLVIFFITILFASAVIHYSGETQYKLGETVGITETTRFIFDQDPLQKLNSIQLN